MASGTITLTIAVDQAGRTALHDSGQQIVIVRAMSPAPDPVVACAVFNPFGDNTNVLFYDALQIFVMQGAPQVLGTVKMQITQATALGSRYTFSGSEIGWEQPAYSSSVVGLVNQDTAGPLSAGLAQQMNISNGDCWQPIAISVSPANETVYFEPVSEILVFVAARIVAGEILPAALLQPAGGIAADVAGPPTVGPYLSVKLTEDVTIHFDDRKNCFAPGPLRSP